MDKTKMHPFKRCEVSIIKFRDETGTKFKVTRRVSEASVAETKIFNSKEEAKKQFEEWLN